METLDDKNIDQRNSEWDEIIEQELTGRIKRPSKGEVLQGAGKVSGQKQKEGGQRECEKSIEKS